MLIVVQSKTDRRFFGMGELRKQYLATTGKALDGSHETKPSDLVDSAISSGSMVTPLEETPSPSEATQRTTNRLIQVIGLPKSKRSLNLENLDWNVRNVLCTRPTPVLLPSEQGHSSEETELSQSHPAPEGQRLIPPNNQIGFQPTPSPGLLKIITAIYHWKKNKVKKIYALHTINVLVLV